MSSRWQSLGWDDLVFLGFMGLMLSLAAGAIIYTGLTADPNHVHSQFTEGKEAGRAGVPATANPYAPGDDGMREVYYERWAKGWKEGYLERQEAEKAGQGKTTTTQPRREP